MKLYQTTADDPSQDSGAQVTWNGSGADASKQRSAYKKAGLKGVGTEEVDVPTNKTDLLAWLNTSKIVVA